MGPETGMGINVPPREKPQPLKDADGRINDPEIAEAMADDEQYRRDNPDINYNQERRYLMRRDMTEEERVPIRAISDKDMANIVNDKFGQKLQEEKEYAYEDEVYTEVRDAIVAEIKAKLTPEQLRIFLKYDLDNLRKGLEK
jgi:hypothetical protein